VRRLRKGDDGEDWTGGGWPCKRVVQAMRACVGAEQALNGVKGV
jgi:hypothetical protein